MKSLFLKFTVFFLVAFFCKSALSQTSEMFNSSTYSVKIGDSCIIPQEYYESRWYGSVLSPETTSACDSIYAFLKQNPSVSIAIIVHSDFRPILMGNDTLTMRRANRLKQEILKHGDIDSNRIIAIGMGYSQLRVVTKEIHKQYKFLPVGQVLSAEFCKTLVSNRQNYEIAIGLNRRAVVKIVENYAEPKF